MALGTVGWMDGGMNKCIGDTLIRNFTGLICLIGPFQLAIHMVQNRHAGEQNSHWDKTDKGNYHLKLCMCLFVLSQCYFCSPAGQFCTTWMASCKKPILSLYLITERLNKLSGLNRPILSDHPRCDDSVVACCLSLVEVLKCLCWTRFYSEK